MKKTIATLLWMLAFFSVGFVIFTAFDLILVHFTPNPTDPASWDNWRVTLIRIVDWLFPIGLPVLALILCIVGKLPGTRSSKDLVTT
jgi:hypothetical protein